MSAYSRLLSTKTTHHLNDGLPVIDYRICKIYQKCVAICPSQAILVNNTAPEKIDSAITLKSGDLLALLARRRSTKIFKEKGLSLSPKAALSICYRL